MDAPVSNRLRSRGLVFFKRAARGIALLGVLGYGMWLGKLSCLQHRMLYPGAHKSLAPSAAHIPQGVQQIWIESDPDVRVEGWYFPRPRELGGELKTAPAVLMAHGNHECIDHGDYFAAEFNRLGFHVLLGEYRGFGRSTGSPSQSGLTRDFAAFHDWLAARPEVAPGKIVHYGRSLGAAVIAQCAAVRRPSAIILDSPFCSADSMAARYFAPSILVVDHWRTDKALASLGVPTLLIHGRFDSVIPLGEAHKLHAALPGSRLIEHDAGHTSFVGDERRYWSWISEFLDPVTDRRP